MSENAKPKPCPKCGKEMIEQVGGGWYCPAAFGGCRYKSWEEKVKPKTCPECGSENPPVRIRARNREDWKGMCPDCGYKLPWSARKEADE